MKIVRLITMILPILVACGEEDATPVRFTPAVERNVLSSDDTTPALDEIATAALRPPRSLPATATLRASFGGRAGSSPAGSASFAAAGAQTRVDVQLDAGAAGAHYEGSIRRGGCERIGARVAGLNPVSVDSGGSGRAVTYVAVPIDSLAGSPHVLVVGRAGRPEACAGVG